MAKMTLPLSLNALGAKQLLKSFWTLFFFIITLPIGSQLSVHFQNEGQMG